MKALNDLWLYNPKKNEWQLVNAKAVNGTNVRPPCSGCVSCSHSDQAVVFGGESIDGENTWILNMTSGQWSSIHPLNGTVPSTSEEAASWCDRERGTLWIFGGSKSADKVSDFWEFSLVDMQWKEVHSVVNQNFSAPDRRSGSSTWLHPSGILYLFGGKTNQGLLSDFWAFSTQNSTWQRLQEGSSPNQEGHYGELHVPSGKNIPGSRESGLTWIDRNSNLWLFGGSGYDKQQGPFKQPGLLSDLWFYNTTSSLWAWMGGLNTSEGKPVYGKEGLPDLRNLPGPRESAVCFRQKDKLWLFGGVGHDKYQRDGLLNDMWVYQIRHRTTEISQPPIKPKHGLEGDTLKISSELRLLIGLVVLIVSMVISLLVCYRKDCHIFINTKHHKHSSIRYKPVTVKMQVPSV